MIFTKDNIQIIDNVENWQQSIILASKPLLDNKSITKEYVQSMIDSINKLGFYVVLAENIAMPHARPENGSLKTDISFLKVNNSVMYGDNEIRLIFVLSSVDANSHIEILAKLMELFEDEKLINDLLNSNTKEQLLQILGGKI